MRRQPTRSILMVGLAIVHAVMVEKHGGRVAMETETGRGTTFHLLFPLGPADNV